MNAAKNRRGATGLPGDQNDGAGASGVAGSGSNAQIKKGLRCSNGTTVETDDIISYNGKNVRFSQISDNL